MAIRTAHSTKPLLEAIEDLKNQGKGIDPKALVLFASTKYDLSTLGGEMQKAYPGAQIVGCSTAGELVADQMLDGSVVAMFLDGDHVDDVATVLLTGLGDQSQIEKALGALGEHFGTPASELDFEQYVGLILIDGMSAAEERIMDRIGDLTDVAFIGGSAGDDLKFKTTHVLADGRVSDGAAAIMLLRLRNGFEILKTESFKPTGKKLIATKVDEAHRHVIEFNGRPATQAYAGALGIPEAELDKHFSDHPVGLMVGDEPFVRSPQRIEGSTIYFYCQIKEGMELEILEGTDIVSATREALERKRNELGQIGGLIQFNCILRTLELKAEGRCGDYGAIFSGIPSVGFSTYGEEYLGHINQTSTMLLLR
ncbi:MAG TPA: FIST N-terminal domain-containing protein [Fimbriimonadaceae bacterium]|nr:FIST N-terminal domain-containing protein [Fimbriimonadaceae bacterium]